MKVGAVVLRGPSQEDDGALRRGRRRRSRGCRSGKQEGRCTAQWRRAQKTLAVGGAQACTQAWSLGNCRRDI